MSLSSPPPTPEEVIQSMENATKQIHKIELRFTRRASKIARAKEKLVEALVLFGKYYLEDKPLPVSRQKEILAILTDAQEFLTEGQDALRIEDSQRIKLQKPTDNL